jgi:hypothetical protein
MSISTQPHMRLEGEIPVPCDCQLGYHHRPDGEPLIEHHPDGEVIRDLGRHPYCVGVCRYWGSPTEEFDFQLVTSARVSERRVATAYEITDYTVPEAPTVSWDNDPISACEKVGIIRLATWTRKER